MRLLSTASMPLHTLPCLLGVAAAELHGALRGGLAAGSLSLMVPSVLLSLSHASKELAVLLAKLELATPPSRALAAARATRPLRQPALLSWLSATTDAVASLYDLRGEWAATGTSCPISIAQHCCAHRRDAGLQRHTLQQRFGGWLDPLPAILCAGCCPQGPQWCRTFS